MTLLEIDTKYLAASKLGTSFGGHPQQLDAAAAMFNNWPFIKSAIEQQAETIERLKQDIITAQHEGVGL